MPSSAHSWRQTMRVQQEEMLRLGLKRSQDGTSLMSPEQHRKRAQQLRANGNVSLAKGHEMLANLIEKRRQARKT